jgi:hypothetical protein
MHCRPPRPLGSQGWKARQQTLPTHASSREAAGGRPGVENKLGLAPPPLTASGLDMRDGHPAEIRAGITKRGSHASAPSFGAILRIESALASARGLPLQAVSRFRTWTRSSWSRHRTCDQSPSRRQDCASICVLSRYPANSSPLAALLADSWSHHDSGVVSCRIDQSGARCVRRYRIRRQREESYKDPPAISSKTARKPPGSIETRAGGSTSFGYGQTLRLAI